MNFWNCNEIIANFFSNRVEQVLEETWQNESIPLLKIILMLEIM